MHRVRRAHASDFVWSRALRSALEGGLSVCASERFCLFGCGESDTIEMSSDEAFRADLAEFLSKARGGVRLPAVVIREFPTYAIDALKLEEVMEVEGLDVDSFVEAVSQAAYGGKPNPILMKSVRTWFVSELGEKALLPLKQTSPPVMHEGEKLIVKTAISESTSGLPLSLIHI